MSLFHSSRLDLSQAQLTGAQCIVRLFQRQPGKQNAIQEYQTIPFSQKPQDVKLSRKGFCLIHVTDKLQLHTPGYVLSFESRPLPLQLLTDSWIRGSTTIPLGEKDVMDFAFSGDGEYFCLWERDRNYHYWSVWGADLKLVRGTIRLKHEVSIPRAESALAVHAQDRKECDRKIDFRLGVAAPNFVPRCASAAFPVLSTLHRLRPLTQCVSHPSRPFFSGLRPRTPIRKNGQCLQWPRVALRRRVHFNPSLTTLKSEG